MSLIRCVTGTETMNNGSSGLAVQLIAQNGVNLPTGMTALYIGDAAKKGRTVRESTKPVFLPASNNGIRDQGCYWDATFEVPEGTVLRVSARKRERVGGQLAQREKKAVMFIRAREDAALRRISMERIDSNQSSNIPILIEGRFDVISLREVGQAGGTFSAEDLQLGRPDVVRALLEHTQIASARRAPDKVKTEVVRDHEGEEVRVTTKRSRRAINIG